MMSIQLANSKKECETVTWWPTVSSVDPPPRAILGLRSFYALLRAPGTFPIGIPSAHSTLTASLVLTEAKVLQG